MLYFAGHGTYQRDSTAPNGLRNYIVMYDRPHVPDNIMNEWVKKIPTAKLVWIFDCCYSGGIAKKGRKSRGEGNVPIDEDQPGKVIENGDESIYFNNRAIIASADAQRNRDRNSRRHQPRRLYVLFRSGLAGQKRRPE